MYPVENPTIIHVQSGAPCVLLQIKKTFQINHVYQQKKQQEGQVVSDSKPDFSTFICVQAFFNITMTIYNS